MKYKKSSFHLLEKRCEGLGCWERQLGDPHLCWVVGAVWSEMSTFGVHSACIKWTAHKSPTISAHGLFMERVRPVTQLLFVYCEFYCVLKKIGQKVRLQDKSLPGSFGESRVTLGNCTVSSPVGTKPDRDLALLVHFVIFYEICN